MSLDNYESKFGISAAVLKILRENGFNDFTETQKAALEAGLCHGESLCVSAPTSSGKTTIAEIAAIEAALKVQ